MPPRLTDTDESRLIDIVRTAARSEILSRFGRLSDTQISTKSGPQDLVTEADLAAEAAITSALAALFPDAMIYGEEAATADPALRAHAAAADLAFIIDPVDGTWNFARDLPLFGVILCATRNGVPIFGLLYDPVTDDAIVAREDTPARRISSEGHTTPLTTAAPDLSPGTASLSGIAHVSLMPDAHQRAIAPLVPDFARLGSLRCSCHEYRLTARGALDFVLSGMLNPWDHAAGVLICQRAGGVARMLDGSAYTTAQTSGYLLTAANEATWQVLQTKLAPALMA